MFSQIAPTNGANSSLRIRARWWLLLSVVLILSVPSARAQVTASITGIITDPSGAAVPSATVTTTDKETDVSRIVMTDGSGSYLILALPIGLYEVKVSKPGFQEFARSGIELKVSQEATIDIRLQVSEVKAAVTVYQDAAIVTTST